jgi:hypothetical protein
MQCFLRIDIRSQDADRRPPDSDRIERIYLRRAKLAPGPPGEEAPKRPFDYPKQEDFFLAPALEISQAIELSSLTLRSFGRCVASK